jgi:hypothetical protein
MGLAVREKPPLRLHYDVETPSGRHYRWAEDEPQPANNPVGSRFSDVMPGGFDTLDLTLPRKPGVDYSDLQRLSTIRALGAGAGVAGEYRLQSVPRTSGEEIAVTPSAVGWQAHLEDDKSAQEIYVDRDLSHWESASTQRKLVLLGLPRGINDGSVSADDTTGVPALELGFDGAWTTQPDSNMWYDAQGRAVGEVDYAHLPSPGISANFGARVIASTDDLTSSTDIDTLAVTATASGTLSATGGDKRFVMVDFRYNAGAAGSSGTHYAIFFTQLAVIGDHGITPVGTVGTGIADIRGVLASDVVAHAVSRWAPLINYTTGPNGSITPTSFVISQLEFRDQTSAAEIIKGADRFHLRDWAVWEGPTFYYHDRGARGRKWRARIKPAQLAETGPQVERLWNGVLVSYQDVDGTTKVVGPTGSGAFVESTDLEDDDPLNPANQLGIRRWDMLQMPGTSTAEGATEVGARFLAESRQLDSSGQASLVGHVEDDKGIQHPYWRVRAGDQISFVDASDPSYRRIVKTEKNVDTRTCQVDLDAPPQGLDALLERLQVVLVPLGL